MIKRLNAGYIDSALNMDIGDLTLWLHKNVENYWLSFSLQIGTTISSMESVSRIDISPTDSNFIKLIL